MRPLKIALTALALVLPAYAHAAGGPVAPEAHAFQIGAFKAWSVRDLTNVVPNDNSVIG